jgi:O-methyltransferase
MTAADNLETLLALHDQAVRELVAGRFESALRLFELALRQFSGYAQSIYAMQETMRTFAASRARTADPSTAMPPRHPASSLYLDLLERALTGMLYRDPPDDFWSDGIFNAEARRRGEDWPSRAQTMIGLDRLHHLRGLVEQVIADGVPGDLIETGVWRGGACIMMRGVLKAHGDTARRVWVADSFKGLPPPDPTAYGADGGDSHHTYAQLAVSEQAVRENFEAYGLLDEQVCFLPGWFKDTLSDPRIQELAILRIDGDLYQSTMESLQMLYPKLAPGGFVVLDDFCTLAPVLRAVIDYRHHAGIDTPILPVDRLTVYWRKPAV